MPYKGRNNYEKVRRISNLSEYLFLRSVHQTAGFFSDGRYYYEGIWYSEKDFLTKYPKPTMTYKVEQLDGRQVETA